MLCSKCKKEDKENSTKEKKIYKKCGCKECNYTGYEGRKIVSSIYFLSRSEKEKLKYIYEDTSCFSNEGMRNNLDILLYGGYISKNDYDKFVEGELSYE